MTEVISQAARNVSILLNRKLECPPVPIKSVRKQEDTNVSDTPLYNIATPVNIVKAYEIWTVYLEKNEENLDKVYVVIAADNTTEGYRNGNWSNVEYRGFYTTPEEAQNEISGYIR